MTQLLGHEARITNQVLNESTSYPYTPPPDTRGISLINNGNDTVTVVINNGITDLTINCPAGGTYDGNYKKIVSINVTDGTTYQIEVRSA